MLGDSSRLDSFHTLSPRFLTWRIFLCHIFIYLSQSFQLLIWCSMMYSLNFCPRNRGALGNQMMLGRPMGQQSLNIASMCVFLKTSWFLSVLLHGVSHGLAAPQFDTLKIKQPPWSDILEPRIWGIKSFSIKKPKVSQFVNGDHSRTPKCREG